MILLKFAHCNHEYAITAQTLTEANQYVNNMAKKLMKQDELRSLRKIGHNYYICHLSNDGDIHIHLSQPEDVYYRLQFFDGNKLVKSYKLKNINDASQLLFEHRDLDHKLFIVADNNDPIEYQTSDVSDLINAINDSSDNDTAEQKPDFMKEYTGVLPAAIIIAAALSLVILFSAANNNGYVGTWAYWLLIAILIITIIVTKTRLKPLNTHPFCHIALGAPIFFAVGLIILGTLVKLSSVDANDNNIKKQQSTYTIANDLKDANDYTATASNLGIITSGVIDGGMLFLLYRIATTDYKKRK